jgi:hypothetical protein
MMVGTPSTTHAACGDCEDVRDGWIGQPVNSATSLAYVAGGFIVWRARRVAHRRWTISLVALGIGSVAYHGPGNRVGKTAHDVSLIAPVLAAGSRLRFANRHRRVAHGLGVAAVATWVMSRTDSRWCRPSSRFQLHGLWHILSASAIVAIALGEDAA